VDECFFWYQPKGPLNDDVFVCVADTIVSRHRNFLYSAQHSHNVVVKNLATAML